MSRELTAIRKSARLLTRRNLLVWTGALASARLLPAFAFEPASLAPKFYFAAVNRAVDALQRFGAPITAAEVARISELASCNDPEAVAAAEAILNHYTLAQLSLESDGTVHVAVGGARKVLVEQGWRLFLIRVANPSERTDSINFSTGWFYTGTPSQMMPGTGVMTLSQRGFLMDTLNNAPLLERLWLKTEMPEAGVAMVYGMEVPLLPLSGSAIEYFVLALYSRDPGERSANLLLTAFPPVGGVGHSISKTFDFEAIPARVVELGVVDADGVGCVASLTIRDRFGHVYPPLAMRLAPDMYFQEQVYRADGETMRLPDGEYVVDSKRGPEYLPGRQTVIISEANNRIDVKLQRWIDPADWGWYSGDPHIHAGGCLYYQVPTEGVAPETMIRHVRGEGLAIGNVLSWGPSWYYQKQFFSAQAVSPVATLEQPELQAANNATLQTQSTPKDAQSMLRYGMEVSGFPSSHAGHLVLLSLKEQDYPGTRVIEDWPSWNLPILQWARQQDAVAGYAHCGFGMMVNSTELPNYEIPPMNSIGAQEAIIDVTHGLVDFLSGGDTTPTAELNAWYHLLNCGFRLAFIGESDYPCLTGERVGVGRTYVNLDHRPSDDLGYEAWVRNLQRGRVYCGDGRSHFLEFRANGLTSGDVDLTLSAAGTVTVNAAVAALLESVITPETEALRAAHSGDWVWGWHLEKARIGATREVTVELIVNGVSAQSASIIADGTPRPVQFEIPIQQSSWMALRIMPSGHTCPIFVLVDDRPIRASRRSAQWCRTCVEKVWEVKSPLMRASERPEAADAFDHARATYDRIAGECDIA